MSVVYGNIPKDFLEFTALASIIRSNALKDQREVFAKAVLEPLYRLIDTGGGLFSNREKESLS